MPYCAVQKRNAASNGKEDELAYHNNRPTVKIICYIIHMLFSAYHN